jgi:hypothetical protein
MLNSCPVLPRNKFATRHEAQVTQVSSRQLQDALQPGHAHHLLRASHDEQMMMMMILLLKTTLKKSHKNTRTPKTPTDQHYLNVTERPKKQTNPQAQTLYEHNRQLAEWKNRKHSGQKWKLASKKRQLKW